jgi:hypothetical protein
LGRLVNPRIVLAEKSFDRAQTSIPRQTFVKGGSFYCAGNYCLNYWPTARQPQIVDTEMSHSDFRFIVPTAPTAAEEYREKWSWYADP